MPDVVDALRLASQKGYALFVISNQGGIAKHLYTKQMVEQVHKKLEEILSASGVHLQEVYYCPHHEKVGKCLCRKPNSLMLEKAIARYGIDPEASLFIGDSERDISAAAKVGVKGVLIEPNAGILQLISQLT